MRAALRTSIFAARATKAFGQLVWNPGRLDTVFGLVENVKDLPSGQKAIARSLARPHVAEAARARVRLPPVTLEALEAYPAQSLGWAFARFLRTHGLDPASLPRRPDATDLEWINAHIYETHDIWHVVTGFEPDVAGELGLQAFYAAQAEGMVPIAILSAGLLNTLLFNAEEKSRRMDAIARGYAMGQQAKDLVGVDWSARFDQPLEQVRADLAIRTPN